MVRDLRIPRTPGRKLSASPAARDAGPVRQQAPRGRRDRAIGPGAAGRDSANNLSARLLTGLENSRRRRRQRRKDLPLLGKFRSANELVKDLPGLAGYGW